MPFVMAPAVSAAPEIDTSRNTLTVTGRVVATHHIVVDAQDTIISITSNTTELGANLRVYRGAITPQSVTPINTQVQQQYNQLAGSLPKQIGVIYERPPASLDLTRPQPSLRDIL